MLPVPPTAFCANNRVCAGAPEQSERLPSGFLVAYDYGMGGLWAVVIADSADQITTRYPETGTARLDG
jgi:hypothetical protein